MNESAAKVVHYIQRSLYDGRQPNKNGVYIYSKAELVENAGFSSATFNRCKEEVCVFLEDEFDLEHWAK